MLSHCSSGLQIEIEDKENEPVVQAALLILAECGVDVVRMPSFQTSRLITTKARISFGRA